MATAGGVYGQGEAEQWHLVDPDMTTPAPLALLLEGSRALGLVDILPRSDYPVMWHAMWKGMFFPSDVTPAFGCLRINVWVVLRFPSANACLDGSPNSFEAYHSSFITKTFKA